MSDETMTDEATDTGAAAETDAAADTDAAAETDAAADTGATAETDAAAETGAAAQRESGAGKSRRVDPVALVAGLIFIAVAAAALTDRFWADLDPVLVVGGIVIAVGVALMVNVILRHRRRGHDEGSPS